METHLEEDYDNKRVKKDEFGKFSSSELIKSIESRIVQHRELIKRDEGLIYDGVDCVEVVTSSIERIKERNAKIGELRELIEDCL